MTSQGGREYQGRQKEKLQKAHGSFTVQNGRASKAEKAISRVSIEVLIDAFGLVLSLKICSRFIQQSISACLFSLSSLILFFRVFGFVCLCSLNWDL